MNNWLKRSLALYSANGLNFLLNILIIPIIIHYIGFQGYGLYSVYIIISSTLLLLDSALSKSAVSIIYSTPEEQRAEIISATRAAYTITGVVLLISAPLLSEGIAGVFPLVKSQLNLAYWAGATAIIEYTLALPGQYFQMLNVLRSRHFTYARYQFYTQLIRFITVGITAAITQQIEWVFLAITIRKAPEYILLWLLWRRQETERHSSFKWSRVRTIFHYASPIAGIAFLQVLSTEFISIYISHFYGAETLGKYRAIYDILNKIWFIATLYPILVYPKICEWLAEEQKRSILKKILSKVNLGSALSYGAIALTAFSIYPFLKNEFPWLIEAAPFSACLLVGICMSGHVRLGYEFLQAQKASASALIINLSSLTTGALTLLLFSENSTKEIGWAWIVSQLIAVIAVDIRNNKLLSSKIRKSLIGILPWLGVGACAIIPAPNHEPERTVASLLLLGVFMASLAILIKYFFALRKEKCQD
ncbi:oligosaccharide flippase family protein [Pseudomonas piscis]|uniref:Oligosaccharide flippase family protein n=1 Tax=Pseudomonas piscis TaxID=2614538 RepID=A0ABY9NC13_9PSED|nr:oligosaccharide flippase family protein [Pseudomonas piscis]WMN16070.1 oligosaccharide flippase family protein [Pseudomonas piscis]